MKGDRERLLGAGMNDYVSKPIDKGQLFLAIASCMGMISAPDAGEPAIANDAVTSADAEAAMQAMLDSLAAVTGTDA
jgi:CheY-like chemotaxis protein